MTILSKKEFTMSEKYTEYKKILQEKLTPKRYHHSLCVADEAVRLAKKYGGDCDRAYLAGLLHDITKNATEQEHLHIFKEFGIMLNDIEKNAEKLWHAMSGAAYIEHILGIDDQEIITAVRDRDYDDIDIMRKKVEISQEAALDYALSYTINDLVSRGKPLHIDTVKAYNENALKGNK